MGAFALMLVLAACYKIGFKRASLLMRNIFTLQWLLRFVIQLRQKMNPSKYIIESVENIVDNDPEIVNAIIDEDTKTKSKA